LRESYIKPTVEISKKSIIVRKPNISRSRNDIAHGNRKATSDGARRLVLRVVENMRGAEGSWYMRRLAFCLVPITTAKPKLATRTGPA